VRLYHQAEFPALGAYSKFVEATNRYSVEVRGLLAVLMGENRQAQQGYPVVLQDTTTIAVCKVARARQHRTFKAWAHKAKTSTGGW
jgi:Transposase DDE domain